MPSIVQETSNSSATSSLTLTFGSNITFGNSVVVCITAYLAQITGNILSITSSNGNDIYQYATFDQDFGNAILWTPAAYGGANTITVTVTTGANSGGATAGIFGYAYETPPLALLDQQKWARNIAGGITSWSSGTTPTTTVANDLWIGYAVAYNATTSGGTITGPSTGGWTNEAAVNGQLINTNYFSYVSGYQFVTSTGTATYSGTCSSQAQTSAQVAAFTLAGAPSGATVFQSAGLSYSPSSATTGTTTFSVNPPPVYTAGEYLIMAVAGGASSTVYPATPAGWTAVSPANNPLGIFTKIASASESAYSVTFNTPCLVSALVASYSAGTYVVGSLFASSGTDLVTFTPPAFPSGVSAQQPVLLFAVAEAFNATVGGFIANSEAINPPSSPWAVRVAGFSPATQTGTLFPVAISLADVLGSTTAPALTSNVASNFFTGFLVLNNPVPEAAQSGASYYAPFSRYYPQIPNTRYGVVNG